MFYIPYKNDLWVLNPEPAPTTKEEEQRRGFRCGTDSFTYSAKNYGFANLEKEKKQTEEMWRFLTDSKWHILPALLFFGMVVFSYRKIYKSR